MAEVIHTDKAPAAAGPYSQAVIASNLVFISGVIAIDPATNELSGDIAQQTGRVFTNLEAVLEAAGSGMDKVLKTTVYITNMGEFGTINSIYAQHFEEPFPARSCVEVSSLPKSALIEIEAIAAVDRF